MFVKDELIKETKANFFASKYSDVEQFKKFSDLWPPELESKQYYNWNSEKRVFLQKRLSKDSALAETYKMNLKERLSLTSQIIDLITFELASMSGVDAKELKVLVDTFEKLTSIQDKTVSLLKIDEIKESEFNKNKDSILDALRKPVRRSI